MRRLVIVSQPDQEVPSDFDGRARLRPRLKPTGLSEKGQIELGQSRVRPILVGPIGFLFDLGQILWTLCSKN